jgi:hypothetical protein
MTYIVVVFMWELIREVDEAQVSALAKELYDHVF